MAIMSSMKLMASRLLRGRSSRAYSTSTVPKMKAYAKAEAADISHQESRKASKSSIKGDMVAVYVAIGMIALSSSLGLYTAMQQLRHSPNVYLKKKRRESVPELVEPEHVVEESDKFVKKSLFRKIAHIRDHDHLIHDKSDLNALRVHVETLKDVGIDPKQH